MLTCGADILDSNPHLAKVRYDVIFFHGVFMIQFNLTKFKIKTIEGGQKKMSPHKRIVVLTKISGILFTRFSTVECINNSYSLLSITCSFVGGLNLLCGFTGWFLTGLCLYIDRG